ncbi:hypothetical protein AZC_2320 [Azorhizobium caulinodans ORS 571]|uniref:DUF4424 domain-containing protein n=1 Tax=Azorhizobium caulinodans (strain ATCC 43989 / DSM 5975 / JCM 20966 / LMG 6465 / NBRC 14845 / NCIMB 13405 / ORS 571) TaxID=438753 RepID=A8I5T9_AZOC5|nr:DUF4424 domain-containing protein [Azorhizobium caulinodans]BAF88318.1 hypothetical protein AZC_2320 [Azorhizobium caulinodans ORS 571]
MIDNHKTFGRCTARLLIAGLLAAAAGTPALANDSTAALSAGGLIMVPNLDIEMASEDLFISEQEVRVRYVFRNTAKQDQTVLVAFPMPDITIRESLNITIPNDASDNFLDFKTTVDGKPVQTQLEQRALALEIDRTAMLRDLKIPLAPYLKQTQAALDALPQDKWKEFEALGLGMVDEYEAGKGPERHLAPQWTLKSTYYWSQTFPAGKALVVEHKYRPSVGMSAGTLIGLKLKDNEYAAEEQRQQMDQFCVDQAFLNGVSKASKASKNSGEVPFSDARIHYILQTGGNWSGGTIRDFKLTVDKGASENLVSFCGKDVKKISPTQFQMTAKDFYPARNLGILILKPYPKQ